MLTLYYFPGACSMAAHIAVEETGAPYQAKLVALRDGEQRSPAYLTINPRGQVPALDVDGRIITENAAILAYLGRSYPTAALLSSDPVQEAQCLALLTWLSNTVDKAFRQTVRPERFVTDEAAMPAVQEGGQTIYWNSCQEIDALLAHQPWLMGERYTVADPYALLYYGWGIRLKLPTQDLANFTRHKDRLLERPAVRTVLQREESPLLKVARTAEPIDRPRRAS
jgi:glutathione S-transferase